MDKNTAKGELAAVMDRLAVIDRERDALLKWRDGLQSWLDLQGTASGKAPIAVQAALPLDEARKPTGKPVGTASLRSTALAIVREAGGRPLTTREILDRAQARGADSAAKDPENVVDLILYTLRKRQHAPLDRPAPRTWRWVGP